MTQTQRMALFQLAADAIIALWFLRRFLARAAAGDFTGADGSAALGAMTLKFFAVALVVSIATQIVGTILVGIANRGELPDQVADERDHAIRRRGDEVSHWATGAGFLVAMVALASGVAVPGVIATLFLAFIASDAVGNLFKLYRYWRG